MSLALSAGVIAAPAMAMDTNTVTLIEMGDLHGTLVPHAAVITYADGTERNVPSAGGLARLKTVVDDIREDNEDAILLSVGDLTHGSAEAMFTVGDAMIVPMNAFGIDVYTPGNWDFGYGPATFRNRFNTIGPKPPLTTNIQVMASYLGCADVPEIEGLTDAASGYICNEAPAPRQVIKASFDTVAVNLYNTAPLPTPLHGQRVLPPYKIVDRGDNKVAVIGLTAAIVPQQADTFNLTFRFTQGVEELQGIIDDVKQDPDCGENCLIVVQSELGLSQNLKIAQSFRDIDVMYSAHTHEVTHGAFLASEDGVHRTTPGAPLSGYETSLLARDAAIVVETNRDMYVGRLDLQVTGNGKVVDFEWEAIPVDDYVDEDEDMADLVAAMEEDFVEGDVPGVIRHTFLPGGFTDPATQGLQLTEDLDTVVGYTDTLLLRHHVLEDTLNNFIADGIREVTSPVVMAAAGDTAPASWSGGVDISMANGFRFGNAVLPLPEPGDDPCDNCGVITLRDLYTWFPIAPAVNVADFSGQAVKNSLDVILNAVFNRNTFLQRGGWYLGLAGMTQMVDLKNRPFSSSGGRIVNTMIGDLDGVQTPLDLGKRYVFASCYGHGNPLDDVCRTGGGANFRFFQLDDADDYTSDISVVTAVNSEGVIVGPVVKQVAPDNFLHPVHALRRYLDNLPGNTVTEAKFGAGHGRVMTVNSKDPGNLPEDEELQIGQPDNTPDTSLVQPPFGAGPKFFSGIINH
jgi:2',3'-cyclic-nucleotide 2'-phosphodiesterase (5'-nucleotidase family)